MTSDNPLIDVLAKGAPELTSGQITTLRRLLNPPVSQVVQIPRPRHRRSAA